MYAPEFLFYSAKAFPSFSCFTSFRSLFKPLVCCTVERGVIEKGDVNGVKAQSSHPHDLHIKKAIRWTRLCKRREGEGVDLPGVWWERTALVLLRTRHDDGDDEKNSVAEMRWKYDRVSRALINLLLLFLFHSGKKKCARARAQDEKQSLTRHLRGCWAFERQTRAPA